MVTSNPVQNCAMVQLYCSEQISIPESFPTILKTYAKAAIRTQPYDILRWSSAYFRCLANNAPPPAKLRLERDCRQGQLTKGYLKALIAQVGKGFFISRCSLQERWKALCLPENELLKFLSLCRMLNWTQVHWLKLVSVMAASLNKTFEESMAMVCELLTDDVEGGMARLPYWMFKLCYTFVAKLDCSTEQSFVNGQLVLPWGDLEEPTPMDKLPRVLSATLLKDTIISTCKAKLRRPPSLQGACTPPSPSATCSTNFMVNSKIEDPKQLLTQCEDFDTIMLLLVDTEERSPREDDFRGPHYISEGQIINAQINENKCEKEREKQSNICVEDARDHLTHESFQILREVGPPWTWLHQFTEADRNTASYNFLDIKSIKSDVTPDIMSVQSFDVIKEQPVLAKKESSESSCELAKAQPEPEPKQCSIEDLKDKIQEATDQDKCNVEQVSSVISVLKHEEIGVLQRAGGPCYPMLKINDIITVLECAEKAGLKFKTIDHLMKHIKVNLLGDIKKFPKKPATESDLETHAPPSSYHSDADDEGWPCHEIETMSIPSDWKEAPPKSVKAPPSRSEVSVKDDAKEKEKKEKKEKPKKEDSKKDELTQIFESTVGIPPEQVTKMPKFCFETKDEDELILGLVPLEETEEVEEEEDVASDIPDSGELSLDGYIQDCSSLIASSREPLENKVPTDNLRYYCCLDAPTLEPKTYLPPPMKFNCRIPPIPGIGPAVSNETVERFLAYLRIQSRYQKGFIHPKNFKEEACPYMIDQSPKESCDTQAQLQLQLKS